MDFANSPRGTGQVQEGEVTPLLEASINIFFLLALLCLAIGIARGPR